MVLLCSLVDPKIAMTNASKYESPRPGLCAIYLLLYHRLLISPRQSDYLHRLADHWFYS